MVLDVFWGIMFNLSNFSEDLNSEDLEADPVDLLLTEGEKPSSTHPTSPHERTSPCPKAAIKRQVPPDLSESFRTRRERVSTGQLLDDPAVMRTVEGPPSLKVWHGPLLLTVARCSWCAQCYHEGLDCKSDFFLRCIFKTKDKQHGWTILMCCAR